MQKYLSQSGLASRRQAEKLILGGRVRVNGKVVRTLGSKILPGRDRVEVDGVVVEGAKVRWILLHKPAGTLTTRTDPLGRPTVFGLLPGELRKLRYVGRLDQDTEGVLLLTNEGEVLHRLTHPSYEVEREYEAWVEGRPGKDVLQRLRDGVELEDGIARAFQVRMERKTREGAALNLVLREGRKREVRRLLEEVGHPALGLRRLRFGPIRLGKLEAGQWRELSEKEIRALRAAVRMEETS
ncbi:pseudouridine synthase [Gemmatimonadota bacterium]